jgi:hypothetical protein
MMKKFLQQSPSLFGRAVATTIAMLCLVLGANAATVTAVSSGNWSSGSTWASGTVPLATDDVVIIVNVIVTLDANASCRTVSNAGTLNIAANTLTVAIASANNATFANTGYFNLSGTGSVILNGSFLTNGAGVFTQSGGSMVIDPNNNNIVQAERLLLSTLYVARLQQVVQ